MINSMEREYCIFLEAQMAALPLFTKNVHLGFPSTVNTVSLQESGRLHPF